MRKPSFRRIITAQAVPLTAYTKTNPVNINGTIKWSYNVNKIIGVFHPLGKSVDHSDSFNIVDMKYKLIVTNDYLLQNGDFVEYNGNKYKLGSMNDWKQYGYRSFECTIAKLTDNRDLEEFINGLPRDILSNAN